jgi:hypothetical protein
MPRDSLTNYFTNFSPKRAITLASSAEESHSGMGKCVRVLYITYGARSENGLFVEPPPESAATIRRATVALAMPVGDVICTLCSPLFSQQTQTQNLAT